MVIKIQQLVIQNLLINKMNAFNFCKYINLILPLRYNLGTRYFKIIRTLYLI